MLLDRRASIVTKMNRDQATRLAPLLDPFTPAGPELRIERPEPALDALSEAWAFGPAKGGHCLLIGALGSGKSTELRHLATAVAGEKDPPLVTLLRLQEQLDPGQVTAAQVLFLLGVASLAMVPTSPPGQLTRDLERAYAEIVERGSGEPPDINDLVARLAVLVGGAAKAGGRPLIGALASGAAGLVKDAPRLPLPGKGLRLLANQTPVTNLAEAVNAAMAWTRAQYMQAPLAFFVDGLDKLDPSSIGELFGSEVLSLPACPVVYSAPLALRYTMAGIPLEPHYNFLTVHNFPIYAVREPGTANASGYASMRELIRLRLEAAQLEPAAVFSDGLAEGGVVDLAIAASGGVAQTYLGLLERALRRALVRARGADFVIDAAVLGTVIDEARKSLAIRVRRSQYAILEQVRADFKRPEGEGADELLYYDVVLNYPNDPAWFWPSPLLEPYLEKPS